METRVLILSAGKGTRMGELGKHLPKPLWPLFKSNLLELKILLWKSRGVDKIYVNVHHQSELIKSYLQENYPEVILLEEKELLDVGGAVHNLAKRDEVNYKGRLWISNSDVFVFSKLIKDYEKLLESSRALLSLVEVGKGSTYTNIEVDENHYITAFSNEAHSNYWTYSGLSLVNLDNLKPVDGVSKFFESVCNFKKEKIKVVKDKDLEYWDLGTLEKYYSSMYQLMTDQKSQFSRFINQHKLLENILLA